MGRDQLASRPLPMVSGMMILKGRILQTLREADSLRHNSEQQESIRARSAIQRNNYEAKP